MPHSLEHDIAFYRYHLLKDSVDAIELGRLESKVEAVFTMCGAAEHLTPQFHYLSACLLVDKIKKKGKNNTTNNPDIEKAFNRLNLLLQWYNLDTIFTLDVSKANLNIVNILYALLFSLLAMYFRQKKLFFTTQLFSVRLLCLFQIVGNELIIA